MLSQQLKRYQLLIDNLKAFTYEIKCRNLVSRRKILKQNEAYRQTHCGFRFVLCNYLLQHFLKSIFQYRSPFPSPLHLSFFFFLLLRGSGVKGEGFVYQDSDQSRSSFVLGSILQIFLPFSFDSMTIYQKICAKYNFS